MTGSQPSRPSLVGRLVAKDLYFYRWLIVGTLLAGVASLAASRFEDGDGVSTGPNLGILLFMTTVIAFGVSLPMILLKEHQTRTSIFVLSLPVSPAQYSFAKVAAALIAFLVPWLGLHGDMARTAISVSWLTAYSISWVGVRTFPSW